MKTRNDIIKEILTKEGAGDFRFDQVYSLVYRTTEFKKYSQMFSLPKELRAKLAKQLGDFVVDLEVEKIQKGGQTEKVLFKTFAGLPIETVKMHYENGRDTYCVSTQSGCAMGCAFCATGKMGLKRSLTADEIVDQVLYFRKRGDSVNNVVFMGMGEPFANPETFKALEILTAREKFNLGARRISVSTVGIVPGIERMTKEFPQINLTFSLHTPFQEQREELMPISKAYPIPAVMEVLAKHIRVTNRKVLLAYMLLKDVTDTRGHAQALAELIKSYPKEAYLFHVNLINYHEVGGAAFRRSANEKVHQFKQILYDHGIRCTVRQDFGEDIDAACGQLSGGRET